MQRRTHAAIGAWTLGPTPPAQAWGDAFRSIELVGSTTTLRAIVEDAEDEDALSESPIDAARAWLAQQLLPKDVVTKAEASLDVAAAHLRELDLLAGELAQEAQETGGLDPVRLDQVDLMAATLRTYSERLRELLDPDTVEPRDVSRRLQTGLTAAAHGGGLTALVAAL